MSFILFSLSNTRFHSHLISFCIYPRNSSDVFFITFYIRYSSLINLYVHIYKRVFHNFNRVENFTLTVLKFDHYDNFF